GCDMAPLSQRHDEGRAHVARSPCVALEADDLLTCLRRLPARDLVELAPAQALDISSWILPIGGAVDGRLLPAAPLERFAAGAHRPVPALIGNNADETEIFAPRTLAGCPAYAAALRRSFGPDAEAILAAYPCPRDDEARDTFVEATTDLLFDCQSHRILRSLSPAARAAAVPLHRYRYAQTRADPAVAHLRAYHGAELQLVFGTMARFGYTPPTEELALAQIMQRSWAAMARGGSPVHPGTPGWQPYDDARDNALIFATPISTIDGASDPRCEQLRPQ
ncbi:MAG: carboxylesterase family protein, partial [Myxococcales bacterium]|nr:carboxylesterase family protein [Myxococcales bacterium]